MLYGYFRWIRRSDDPLAWSLPFYLAVLTYFRWESGARWWVPMTPALFMCLWFALEPWGRHVNFPRRLAVACLAGLAYWIGVDLPRARDLDQKWPAARSLADQITADRDRVMIDESMWLTWACCSICNSIAASKDTKTMTPSPPRPSG